MAPKAENPTAMWSVKPANEEAEDNLDRCVDAQDSAIAAMSTARLTSTTARQCPLAGDAGGDHTVNQGGRSRHGQSHNGGSTHQSAFPPSSWIELLRKSTSLTTS